MVQKIDRSARSAADATTVYSLLADGTTWPAWSPLDSFELESGDGGLGSIRVFRTGRTVSREEVVELVPGRRFSYALLSGLPLRGYRADVDLTPADGGTVIHWRSSFTPKVPGTGRIYRWALGKFIQRCVEGLATHATTLAGKGS
ncbi:SRPBCC family protein [Virgisporangium ochraceum]|uniref:MxaD family protein n=1 Tax=Virgisporangium ochraceum TaxID=65505 RepID=A0A8J3ZUU6_9ACTN|nr:SRPBCC family protein [Virgisporangium ochraceum]GIJ68865.1 MxaD family protein [Virgisporangium ochraceum]